jgi:hypothetical protein
MERSDRLAGGPDLKKDSIQLRVPGPSPLGTGEVENRAGGSPTLRPPVSKNGKPQTPLRQIQHPHRRTIGENSLKKYFGPNRSDHPKNHRNTLIPNAASPPKIIASNYSPLAHN